MNSKVYYDSLRIIGYKSILHYYSKSFNTEIVLMYKMGLLDTPLVAESYIAVNDKIVETRCDEVTSEFDNIESLEDLLYCCFRTYHNSLDLSTFTKIEDEDLKSLCYDKKLLFYDCRLIVTDDTEKRVKNPVHQIGDKLIVDKTDELKYECYEWFSPNLTPELQYLSDYFISNIDTVMDYLDEINDLNHYFHMIHYSESDMIMQLKYSKEVIISTMIAVIDVFDYGVYKVGDKYIRHNYSDFNDELRFVNRVVKTYEKIEYV